MLQGKLFDLMRSLSRAEWDRFTQYLASPYFNNDDRLERLSNFYRHWSPEFPKSSLTKPVVFREIWGEAAEFKEKWVRDLNAALSVQLQQFLQQEQLAASPVFQQWLYVEALAARSLQNHLLRAVEKTQMLVSETRPTYDWFQYQVNYLLLRELGEGVKESFQRIRVSGEWLDRAFRLSKLRLATELRASRAYAVTQESVWMLEPLLSWCQEHSEEITPVDRLYVDLLDLLDKGYSGDRYQAIRTNFSTQLDNLSKIDREVIWQGLLNFVMRLTDEEGVSLLGESFSLYRLGLDYGIPIRNGRLSDTTFSNIVINAASLGEFAWAESFIKEYADTLDVRVRENALALSWAYWHYHKTEYDEALDQLRDVSYVSVGYAVRGRSIQLRNYYEAARMKGHCQPELYSHIEAFRRYVQRSKRLSEEYKEAYLKYIGFTRRLARTLDNPNFSAKRLNRLEEEIRSVEDVVAREWLMKKVAEFSG